MIKEVNFDEVYKQLLTEYQKQRSKGYSITPGKVYVSSVCGTNCDRQLRYSFEGCQEDSPEIWPGIENEIGNLVHEVVQATFFVKKVLKEVEKSVEMELEGTKFRMKIDGVYYNDDLLELKTLGPRDYRISKPREKDLLQLNFYLGATGGKNEGYLTYLKRDNGQHIKTFKIGFDKEKYKKILFRICKIITGKDVRANKSDCRFCGYKERCKKEMPF